MVYDAGDVIVARFDIASGTELTLDYGTFVANFDQDFICSCGSPLCRGRITKDDWKHLRHVYGHHFAGFILRGIESEKSSAETICSGF